MSTILGKGSYGEVSIRDGMAVKKFSKITHLIQEYTALVYLRDCKHVVHALGVDFENLELHMELYDTSLRKWLEDHKLKRGKLSSELLTLLKGILLGLIELHDRKLVHGDIKPGNILVKKEPLKAVLGDCGFVSIDKYSKVERTAAIYREPTISHDANHDMFSFGVCLLEFIGDVRINRQASYEELRSIIRDKVDDAQYKVIIRNLLNPNKSERYTSRQVYDMMFTGKPSYFSGNYNNSEEDRDKNISIRNLIKETAKKYDISRGRIGYKAINQYIEHNKIDSNHHEVMALITILILSSIFGKSGYKIKDIRNKCSRSYENKHIYKFLREILADTQFINVLFSY